MVTAGYVLIRVADAFEEVGYRLLNAADAVRDAGNWLQDASAELDKLRA